MPGGDMTTEQAAAIVEKWAKSYSTAVFGTVTAADRRRAHDALQDAGLIWLTFDRLAAFCFRLAAKKIACELRKE